MLPHPLKLRRHSSNASMYLGSYTFSDTRLRDGKMEATEIFQRIIRLQVCRHGGVKVCGDRFRVCLCIYTCENFHTLVRVFVCARAEYVGAVTVY